MTKLAINEDYKKQTVTARYLELARSIHKRFTAEEEKEKAVVRAAEALAASKNNVIIQAVQEVLEFCDILAKNSKINSQLIECTEGITQRLFNNRCTFTIEKDPITVNYEAPLYHVDLQMPDHIALSLNDNAYIHIGFSPVKVDNNDPESSENSTTVIHLFSKQYRIKPDGTFNSAQSKDKNKADPIADIITDLRSKLGYDFFEQILMPHLESQSLLGVENKEHIT